MNNVMMITALILFVVTGTIGAVSENTWRNTAISWGLLTVGCIFFVIALTA